MSIINNLRNDLNLNLMKWSKSAPMFPICSKQIEVIKSPNDFYNSLKVSLFFGSNYHLILI